MKTYFWQDLPYEIQNDLFVTLSEKTGSNEVADDYINRNNTLKTLGEWEETIENY